MQRYPLDSYAYSLARVRWDVFGTLTFRSVPSPNNCVWPGLGADAPGGGAGPAALFSASDCVARGAGGNDGQRFHFHFLLGGTQARNEITLAHQLEHRWYGLFGQGAISKCRAYDRSRAGVEYVTKCLSEGCWGANEYELRKFNLADTVTLSRSVFRVIRSLDRMGTDAAARTCEKDGLPDEGSTGSAGLNQRPRCYAARPAPGLRRRKRDDLAS